MRPVYEVIAEGEDITEKIRGRLLSISVTDEPGIQSDKCQLELDDEKGQIEIPREEATLEVSLGYAESGLVKMGTFVVDEIGLSGPPKTMAIRAKAADMLNPFKVRRTKAWDQKTIGAIVAEVVAPYGLKARVAEKFSGLTIEHIDQTDESDLHFLTRLGREHDALAKPTNGFFVFVPLGSSESASGESLEVVRIHASADTHYDVTIGGRTKHQKSRAAWHNSQTGKREFEDHGDGETTYEIPRSFPDAPRARAAAEAQDRRLKRTEKTLRLTMPGLPTLLAESPIETIGFRVGVDGLWVCDNVEHYITASGGFTTSLTANIPP